jgi:hypothetical protein
MKTTEAILNKTSDFSRKKLKHTCKTYLNELFEKYLWCSKWRIIHKKV